MNNIVQLLHTVSTQTWNMFYTSTIDPSAPVCSKPTKAFSQINWTEFVKYTWPLDDVKKAGINSPFDIRTNNKYIFEVKECKHRGSIQLNNTRSGATFNNQVIYYLSTIKFNNQLFHSIISGDFFGLISNSIEELHNHSKDFHIDQVMARRAFEHDDSLSLRPKYEKSVPKLYKRIYECFNLDYTPTHLCITKECIETKNYSNIKLFSKSTIKIKDLIKETYKNETFYLYVVDDIENINIFKRKTKQHKKYEGFGEFKTLIEWSKDSRCEHSLAVLRNRIYSKYYKNYVIVFQDILNMKNGEHISTYLENTT